MAWRRDLLQDRFLLPNIYETPTVFVHQAPCQARTVSLALPSLCSGLGELSRRGLPLEPSRLELFPGCHAPHLGPETLRPVSLLCPLPWSKGL